MKRDLNYWGHEVLAVIIIVVVIGLVAAWAVGYADNCTSRGLTSAQCASDAR